LTWSWCDRTAYSSYAHLAHAGAPIADDTLNGGAALAGHDGSFLHAVSITLPLRTDRLMVEAPVPERFAGAPVARALA
jgi:hypothetical protein